MSLFFELYCKYSNYLKCYADFMLEGLDSEC